ncbi:MAG: hypothetical protein WAK29_12120 [Terriglobales bacterium]
MIVSELSHDLERALVSRNIQSGLDLLRANNEAISKVNSSSKCAGMLIGCLSKWIDMDFSLLGMLEVMLRDGFPKSDRHNLPFRDFAYLRFAEGVIRMYRGKVKSALRELTASLCDAVELEDTDLQVASNYFIARCFRIEGHYDDAERHAIEAETLSGTDDDSREQQIAVIRLLMAWLKFQKGNRASAEDLWDWVKIKLNDSSDFVSKGNLWSLRARMDRRLGREHLGRFQRAVQEYEKGGEAGLKHPNLARVLANRALSNILEAHRIIVKAKEEHDRQRVNKQKRSAEISEQRHMIEHLHKKADKDLTRAENIFRPLGMNRGLATCCLRRAFMYLEQTHGDSAREKVKEAYRLASEDQDHITMGRAKVLECMIEDQDYVEGVGDDPKHNAQLAHDCASEAVRLAQRTENPGLLARAYLAMGFTLLDSQNDQQKAAEYLRLAEEVYDSGGLDFLWEHVKNLRARIASQRTMSAELSEWSEVPENRSFDNLENLIYSLVWHHVGEKIGRVAENLQVDPDTAKKHLVRAGCIPADGAASVKKTKQRNPPHNRSAALLFDAKSSEEKASIA